MENFIKIKNENCTQKGQVCRCRNGSEFAETSDDHCGDCTAYMVECLHEYICNPADYPAGRDMYIINRNTTIREYLPKICITPEHLGSDATWEDAEKIADRLNQIGYDVISDPNKFSNNIGVIAQYDWDRALKAICDSLSDES